MVTSDCYEYEICILVFTQKDKLIGIRIRRGWICVTRESMVPPQQVRTRQGSHLRPRLPESNYQGQLTVGPRHSQNAFSAAN